MAVNMFKDLVTFNHFNLVEAFANCSNSEVVECIRRDCLGNVLTLLHELDHIRSMFNAPIRVCSCYRGKDHNKRCGGVQTSQHLSGSAIDIQPLHNSPSELRRLAAIIFVYTDYNQSQFGQVILYDTFIHLGLLDSSRKSTSYFHLIYNDPKLKDFYELPE